MPLWEENAKQKKTPQSGCFFRLGQRYSFIERRAALSAIRLCNSAAASPLTGFLAATAGTATAPLLAIPTGATAAGATAAATFTFADNLGADLSTVTVFFNLPPPFAKSAAENNKAPGFAIGALFAATTGILGAAGGAGGAGGTGIFAAGSATTGAGVAATTGSGETTGAGAATTGAGAATTTGAAST